MLARNLEPVPWDATAADAQQEAEWLLKNRNTTWDSNNTWWWPIERKPFSGGATRNSYKDRLMARIYLPPLSKSPADFTGMARLRPVRPTG